MSKISIPANVEELLTLGNAIYAKHFTDGASSPLHQLTDYNLNIIGPNLQPALEKHKEAESFMRQAKEAFEQRDALMGDIAGVVKASSGLLKAKYAKTPKTLGEWGFDVTETTKPPKVKPAGEKKLAV
jgi:hypothetical protein